MLSVFIDDRTRVQSLPTHFVLAYSEIFVAGWLIRETHFLKCIICFKLSFCFIYQCSIIVLSFKPNFECHIYSLMSNSYYWTWAELSNALYIIYF